MSDKAEGQSISFRPGWLYHLAKTYGANLEKPENVSEVVCGFVRSGLIAAGVEMPKDGKRTRKQLLSPEVAKAIAEVRARGMDPVSILLAAVGDDESRSALAQVGTGINPGAGGKLQLSRA
jgi:hypothetical protein